MLNRRNKLLATAINSGGGGELPPEYQRVEYIESTGTQYIDTLIPSYANFKAKIESEFTSLNGKQAVCASYWGGGGSQFYLIIANGGEVWAQVGLTLLKQYNETEKTKRFFEIEAFDGKQSFVVDGNVIGTGGATNIGRSDTTLYLFASHDITETTKVYARAKAKIYSAIFENEDGTIKANFVPCYRKSDGVIGLFETVNQRFCENIGTGTFLKGADVN